MSRCPSFEDPWTMSRDLRDLKKAGCGPVRASLAEGGPGGRQRTCGRVDSADHLTRKKARCQQKNRQTWKNLGRSEMAQLPQGNRRHPTARRVATIPLLVGAAVRLRQSTGAGSDIEVRGAGPAILVITRSGGAAPKRHTGATIIIAADRRPITSQCP